MGTINEQQFDRVSVNLSYITNDKEIFFMLWLSFKINSLRNKKKVLYCAFSCKKNAKIWDLSHHK